MWYSSGTDSGIWETDEWVAWSNFSSDHYSSIAVGYDAYKNGNGANESVRNNAHSAEDPVGPADSIPVQPARPEGAHLGDSATGKIYEIGSVLRNNDASFKQASCPLSVC